jgi:hypothetical protein
MKTLFDDATYDEVIERLNKLSPSAERQWGKMPPECMMEHTARALEMAMSLTPVKQAFLGKALSWVFKKQFLGEKPFRKNAPTGPDFIVTDKPDFEETRARLRTLLTEFKALGENGTDGNVHRFFGKLTGKQWGETQYKHVDHHLRQFGV